MSRHDRALARYRLEDRYTRSEGRVFLTGTQALARIMLDEARRHAAWGWNTAGFVSGYRGSPLGGVDLEMWRARDLLEQHRIDFMPAINEDMGAAAVLGAQQAHLEEGAEVEGVFAMWYGKGPGVDRSGDALRHGNAYGTAPKGGVLVVAGDDHGCVSSSMPHQSDAVFLSWFMPVLHPASVAEYLEFGEYGFALSRFSSTWVGFKAVSEVVESARSLELPRPRRFTLPPLPFDPAELAIRIADPPSAEIEARMAKKLEAVRAFAEANPIDRTLFDLPEAPFGFVTVGKAHLDLMEALRLLGLGDEKLRALGIDIHKVGMVWPLAREQALAFVHGKAEVMVIEEKRGIVESQLKEYFYDWPGAKPERMVGKFDERMEPLVPWTGELSPRLLLPLVARRLDRFFPTERLMEKAEAILADKPREILVPGATRTPWFCSGCPHGTSTRLPEGSHAISGIGCHVMASWMGRNTGGFAHMGAEGVPGAIRQRFAGRRHFFQNMGEGTWYHSGSLALRQAIAAGANVTFKILFNDAVAMTGGQPVDGPLTPAAVAHVARAEGVERIAVVTDDLARIRPEDFPPRVTFHHRRELIGVQKELREIDGVTMLIYVQPCATELRRRRKRGKAEDPPRFVWINPAVCEGCGDCARTSNCLSIEPLETLFGRKRRINLSSCNKDFSCLEGFCPAMVTVEGARRRKPRAAGFDIGRLLADLPPPAQHWNSEKGGTWNLLVGGVGGTGVVTVGQLVTMAAHLEGRGASVLDFTGFAQKFGTVLSHVRIGAGPDAVHQVGIDEAAADAVIACDMVVASSPKASRHYRRGTRMALNSAEIPTGEMVLDPAASLEKGTRIARIAEVIGEGNLALTDANRAAETLLGDAVFANVIMLGHAWQLGLVPVSEAALMEAIRLNGVAVEGNRAAFAIGRVLAAAPGRLADVLGDAAPAEEDIAAFIARRVRFLTGYQDAAWAALYERRIAAFAEALPAEAPEDLVRLAADGLFRLMSYKDEYEVARLHTETGFLDEIATRFEGVEGDFRIRWHMAPPLLPAGRDSRGRPAKRAFGRPMWWGMKLLARLKRLRGTAFDPFGHTAERREERALIDWYAALLEELPALWRADRVEDFRTILSTPERMRGFGPVKRAAVAREKPRAEAALARLRETPGMAAA